MKVKQNIAVSLSTKYIEHSSAIDFVRTPKAGAISSFVGTTRQWTDGQETDTLFYDCYEPMARSEMDSLAQHAFKEWPIEKVCIIHRLGEVPIGEASVVIAVSSAHRTSAFDACRYLIDTLKEQVPIWKRERYTDGSTEWVEPVEQMSQKNE